MEKKSPLYNSVAKKIEDYIRNEKLRPDDALPSELKMTEMFGVSRVTLRKAITILVNENILYSVKGSGTYVKSSKVERQMYKHSSFKEEMISNKKTFHSKVVEFSIENPTHEVMNILKISEDELVYKVKRLRYGDNELLLLEETFMPVELFPDLTYQIMTQSKYDYIESKGLRIKENFQEVLPILPDKEVASLLDVDKQTPILMLKIYSLLSDETIFEYSKIYYRSDRYTFRLHAIRE